MNEALCSILCGEKQWKYCEQVNKFITFNKDGTGELWCCIDCCYFIAAQLEWRSLPSPQPDQDKTLEAAGPRSPQFLGQLKLEITLSKKLVKHLLNPQARIPLDMNEIFLLDTAFRPKVYTVRIEKGNFIAPSRRGLTDQWGRYSHRLLFDKSPYPPREEWKKPEAGPDGNDFWDHIEFVGRRSPELEKNMRVAMNDIDSRAWGSCVVS